MALNEKCIYGFEMSISLWLYEVCLNEIALVLLCVAMLLVQKTRVTLSTIGYKTKVEVITTWSPASPAVAIWLALCSWLFKIIPFF